jgi:hypothetical protein
MSSEIHTSKTPEFFLGATSLCFRSLGSLSFMHSANPSRSDPILARVCATSTKFRKMLGNSPAE